ncbi:hypothetical protein ACVIVD_001091 [Bradyrhizobium liaoningense]
MISVDLPALGRPTMATRIGRVAASSSRERRIVLAVVVLVDGLRHQLGQRVIELAHALAMLGRNLDGIAEAERKGLHRAGIAMLALALVGDQQHRLVGLAGEIGEGAIGGRETNAGIDDEEQRVGLRDRGFGLLLHARGQRALGAFVETGGIDDGELEVAEPGLAFAAVAGDARQVIDKRELLSNQAVEQRRFADIGPADDGDCEGHRSFVRCRGCACQ